MSCSARYGPCRHSSVPGAERIIGLLINTVPVRARVPGDRLLLGLLRDLDEGQDAVRAFEQTPLIESAACSDVPRGTRLFDTIVVIDEADAHTRLKDLGAFTNLKVALHDRTELRPHPEGGARADHDVHTLVRPSRFDMDFASRVAGLMKRLLHAMAGRPGATLAELPRLPARDERALASFNRTSVQVLAPGSVHECVEAQVDRTPDAVALVYRDQSLTYRELDERANRVANELVALGVGLRSDSRGVRRSVARNSGGTPWNTEGRGRLRAARSVPPQRSNCDDARGFAAGRRAHGRSSAWGTSAGGGAGRDPRRPRTRAVVPHPFGGPFRPSRVRDLHVRINGPTERRSGRASQRHQLLPRDGRGAGHHARRLAGACGYLFRHSVLELFWTLARGFTVVVQEALDRMSPPTSSVGSASYRGSAAEPAPTTATSPFGPSSAATE